MELSYFNARLRGLRGRLIGGPQYSGFLKSLSVEDYISRLGETHYGVYIEKARARLSDPPSIISRALADNLSDTLSLLWKASPEEARPLLKALISPWEAFGLKALIRGIERGAPFEELLDIAVPAGEFDRRTLSILASSKSVPDLISFLDTWGSPYAIPLKEGLEEYLKKRSLLELEIRLDSHMPLSFLRSLRERSFDFSVIREYLSLRIDILNIMTLVKTAGEGYSREGIAGFFIEGGTHLGKDAFLGLTAFKAREEMLKGLSDAVKYRPFSNALKGADAEEPWLLQEALEKALDERFHGTSIVYPLSIALAASYMGMKVREIKNLRLIARGKVFGIPEEEIRRLML